MRISDWSSDVGSSDLQQLVGEQVFEALAAGGEEFHGVRLPDASGGRDIRPDFAGAPPTPRRAGIRITALPAARRTLPPTPPRGRPADANRPPAARSEEHTSELQSLMRISYAVFCLKKKTQQ